MNNNGANLLGLIIAAVAIFALSIGVDLALVVLASLISGIDASFRELLGAAILLAGAQSGVSATPA